TSSIKGEPFLVRDLARKGFVQSTLQTIREGLAEDRWSDSELQKLQSRLLEYNFFADMQRPLGAERAAGILTCDLLARGKYTLSMLASPASGTGEPPAIAGLMPKGWYAREKINYCQLYELELQGTIDPAKR